LIRKRTIIAALAAAALSLPATAHATTNNPFLFLCGFASITDPNTEGGTTQTGFVYGGPLVLIDDNGPFPIDPLNPPTPDPTWTIVGSGTLSCIIQVGESTHIGTDQTGASASGTGVIVLAPSLISYESPTGVAVYLCTQYDDADGTTLYWNDPNDPTVDGAWTTDPNASCGLAIEAGTPE
jgi:hypothetical protein